MQVTQVHTILNTIMGEILGESAIVNEDLSNVVDLGNDLFNANAVDKYVAALVDHIGRVVIVDRPYRGFAPSLMMDAWEFGAVLEKIDIELPAATENKSWELTNGTSYDPNIFTRPDVHVKFYSDKTTYEVAMSFTDTQVKSAFSSAGQMVAFFSAIETAIGNSIELKNSALAMRTVAFGVAETMLDAYAGADFGAASHVRAVNLLKLYNDTIEPATTLTAAKAIYDTDFLKFASRQMALVADRMGAMSTLYNVGGRERFTPKDELHWIMLSDFARAADSYLQADTFHDEFTRLPESELVPFWQGSGEDYGWDSVSALNVTTDEDETVEMTGLLAVMFDTRAAAIANMNPRTTSQYNARAEFTNEWHKVDASYFLDLNENFVCFFIADPA